MKYPNKIYPEKLYPNKIYLEKLYPDNGTLPIGIDYVKTDENIEYVKTSAIMEWVAEQEKNLKYGLSADAYQLALDMLKEKLERL